MTAARARQAHPEAPAWATPWIASFRLALRCDNRSPHTVYRYCDAAAWFAGWVAHEAPQIDDWSQLTEKRHRELLRRFLAELVETYSQKYASSIGGAVAAFFKWYAAEEEATNPFGVVKVPPAPKLGANPPPTLDIGELKQLFSDAEKGRDFESRRDAALLRLFAATGARLSEITGLQVSAITLETREVTVRGKGGKVRTVRYDVRAARALDRYLRTRTRHSAAHLPALWLGVRRRQAMTPSGVRQALQRRAERLGITFWPHMARHTLADAWLRAGGAEADLVAFCGWESTQMLRLYGAKVAGRRALTAYDKLDLMPGI